MRAVGLFARRSALLGSCAGLALAVGVAHADTQAVPVSTTVGTTDPIGPDGFNYYQRPGGYTFTWDFTVNSPISVTQLGYYNSALTGQPNVGGFGSHFVTLTDLSADSQLASVTVTADSPVTGAFNYAPIAPVVLNTTDTYEVSGTMTNQYYLVNLNQSVTPAASQINYQFVVGNIFGSPSSPGTYSDFGPNFIFTAASACTENVFGRNIIALSGDKCVAAPGAYNPTTSNIALPVTYNGFGFYAHGGSIDSPGDVTIATSDPNGTGGSHAIWADGPGSQITAEGTTTIATAGANSFGVFASGGGAFATTADLNIATSGLSAPAVNADGAGSTIALAAATINTSGQGGVGLFANDSAGTGSGGHIVVNGPLTVTTQLAFAYDVFASGAGSKITLNGDSTLNVGAGSFGLYATGGGVIETNAGLTIYAGNAGFGGGVEADAGSAITLGGASTITLTGTGLVGVFAAGTGVVSTTSALAVDAGANPGLIAQGGAIRLGGATHVTTSGANAVGVLASIGGQVVSTGALSVATTGAGAKAVYASGAGSSIDVALGAISTSAALTPAVVADGGAILRATGGTVATSGARAIGLYATGANSVVAARDVAVSTSGAGAHAAQAEGGGVLTMIGGSATTTGVDSYAVAVLAGSSAQLTGATITTSGAGSGGVTVSGGSFAGAGLTILVNGGYNPGSDGSAPTYAVGVANRGGTVDLSDTSIAVKGFSDLGVHNSGGGALTMLGGGIATSGLSSDALVAEGGSKTLLSKVAISTLAEASSGLQVLGAGTVLNGSQLTISTAGGVDESGIAAHGLVNSGGAVTLDSSSIVTQSERASGAVTRAGGATTISNSAIATSGALADAFYAADGASIMLNDVRLTTAGDAAKGLDVEGAGTRLIGSGLTISTTGTIDPATGFHAQGVYNGSASPPGPGATGGGWIMLDHTSVTTRGDFAFGVDTGFGGATQFYGGLITTSGAGAVALLATEAGTSVIAGAGGDGVALAIKTSGASALGVAVHGGAQMVLTGATVDTSGDGAIGLAVSGQGSALTATNVAVTTQGGLDAATGFHASGVYNGPGASGASGGTLTLTNVSVVTGGDGASGLVTLAGGRTSVSGGSIATSGAQATGVLAAGGGAITLTGGSVTTNGANGLVVSDPGSTLSATDVVVTTSAGKAAIYNGPANGGTSGGALTLTNVTAAALAGNSYGLLTGAGGTTTATGGSFTANNYNGTAVGVIGAGTLNIDGANLTATYRPESGVGLAVVGAGGQVTASNLSILASKTGVYDEGTVSLVNSSVRTAGNISSALLVSGTLNFIGGSIATTGERGYGASVGGSLSLTATSIATSGAGGAGVLLTGGSVTATDVTITTQGGNAYLPYWIGGAAVPSVGVGADMGGIATLAGASISTAGADAMGVFAERSGAVALGPDAAGQGTRVSTLGDNADGAVAMDGGQLTLGDKTEITTAGSGAHGVYVSGSTATLSGAVGLTVTGAGAAGVWVDAGAVTATGPLTVRAATYGLYVGPASSINLSAPLSLTTSAADGAAITLDGDNAIFIGTGGGTIHAAGTAIAFLNGVSQSASFTGYDIASAGDLVFVDPANSTLNLTNTTANAGTGNLANVTNASTLTLNANASTLTGAFATTPESTSNFNLLNGSNWTITGPSTVTNFVVSNSSAGFAPGGGFHTLTATNYVGANATLTFNAALGGANPSADQLVINGGRATGTTTIRVNPVDATSGARVPLVTTANGGSIAPGAFTLAGPLVVGGTAYALQGDNASETLVPGMTSAAAGASVATLAQSRQTQAITGRVLTSILTGATEQINCSSCSSGFASFGSFALGAHGRWTLSPSVALLAGASYDSYSGRGVSVNNSLIGAAALRYDPAQMGRYRPFVEAGLAAQPYANVTFKRGYQTAAAFGGSGVGTGNTLSRSVAAFGRVGYIWRLSRTDEAAAYTDLTRSWQWTGGYTESATPGNPFGAEVAASLDTMNVWRVGGQYTHLFGEHIEANVSLAYARAFGAKYGASAAITAFGTGGITGAAPSSFDWGEWGGRLSYRFSRSVIADAFVLGTFGAEPAGTQAHGGLALRMEF